MKIRTDILFLVCITLFSMHTTAQDYNDAARFSFGTYWGLSYKKMITQENGVMATLQKGEKNTQFTALRVFHKPAFPARSSKWFFGYGYGAHIAYRTEINSRNAFRPFAPPYVHEGKYVSPGIDAFLSLEYRFLKYPFALSGDFMPNFEFFGPGVFRVNMTNVCLTASFVF